MKAPNPSRNIFGSGKMRATKMHPLPGLEWDKEAKTRSSTEATGRISTAPAPAAGVGLFF
ncbi:hypothetical protein ACG2F4_14915 [Halalkalibaculum sp. DA3122]|uniref:hypothetical protein n=1 Tax=Halalkalibaculum sp. DA3122 TaxID=3373607 RepID=UPI0037543E16